MVLTAEEGPLLGLREGDRLGLDVSYVDEMNSLKRLKELEHIMCLSDATEKRVNVNPTSTIKRLTSLDGDPVGTAVGLEEGETDGPFDGDAEGSGLGDDVGGSEGETV